MAALLPARRLGPELLVYYPLGRLHVRLGRLALDVLHELVDRDLPVPAHVGVPHDLLDLGLPAAAPQHPLQLDDGDLARHVHVEALEGLLQEALVHHDPRRHHRGQEVRVVYLLVVVVVEGAENPLDLLVVYAHRLLQHLLQLVHGYRALLVLVYLQELGVDQLALVGREGPGHHGHADAAELRRLGELDDGLHYLHVELRRVAAEGRPVCYPWVLQRRLRAEALLGVHDEQPLQKVLQGLRQPLPVRLHAQVRPLGDLLLDLLVGARERHVAHDEDEGHAPEAPQVAGVGVAPFQDLGRRVVQGAAVELHVFVLAAVYPAEAEVDELQAVVVFLGVEEVLALDVAVDDLLAVQVVQGQQHLVCRVRGVFLRELPVL
mmetsp:Transcript_117545/g.333110  ORF Transcript_117545/g.333110 Transcript_117545/m.333110 type:complete len:377 (+) Transcript_117545:315-1445(+)